MDILVGTPGRIQDFIRRGNLDLSQLSHVVLDEVDRMLDMGFVHEIRAIINHTVKVGETALQFWTAEVDIRVVFSNCLVCLSI